jgi:hypothetical protein
MIAPEDSEPAPASVDQDDPEHERCYLPLSGWTEPTDCRYCDPICPVFGTHGHLWKGDEDAARDAYDVLRSEHRPKQSPIGENGLCTICSCEVCEHTVGADEREQLISNPAHGYTDGDQ